MKLWWKSLGSEAHPKAARDAVLVLLSIVVFTVIEVRFDFGDRFFAWAARSEDLEIDEIPFILLWTAAVSIWFAVRRFRDVRVEFSRRERELAARKRVEMQLRETKEELENLVEERTQQIDKEVAARLTIEKDLRVQQAELAHINRLSTSTEMVSALAHEISQPLFALNSYAQGCIELLKSGDDRSEKLFEGLNQILEQSKRATRNVTWIREFVEKREPQAVAVDLNQVTGDVMELLDRDGREHGVAFELALADSLPKVIADPIQLQQVLVNLATNGMAVMSERGSAAHRLKIQTVNHDNAAVEIQVQDSGPGLKGEQLEKVFQPFYSTKGEGLGMGLTICRSIVTTFGGRLWATSDGLTGTTMHARFPAAVEARTDEP